MTRRRNGEKGQTNGFELISSFQQHKTQFILIECSLEKVSKT